MPVLTKFTNNDAGRIITRAIDERINMLTGTSVHYSYGTVAAITSSYLCSVYLFDDDTEAASEDFVFENGVIPNVGDSVRVAIDDRGNRWLAGIQQPNDGSFNKLEIDPADGEIRIGAGSAAPVAILGNGYVFPVITAKPATDPGSGYPLGLSTFLVSGDASWPQQFGTVLTIRHSDARMYQQYWDHRANAVPIVWYRTWNSVTDTGWSAWAQVATVTTPNVSAFARQTSTLTVTTTQADVPGCSLSLAAGKWLITGVFDAHTGGAGTAATIQGYLSVGGINQTALAIWQSTDGRSRGTVMQQWVVTLAATTTVKLRADASSSPVAPAVLTLDSESKIIAAPVIG